MSAAFSEPLSFHPSPTGSHLALHTVMKYIVVINFQLVLEPSNVNTVRQLSFNGKGFPRL
jgi:hypothetical protein